MAASSRTRRLRKQPGTRLRPVKQEVRDNLVRKLQAGETLFPGIIGYEETVIPQLVNAILSRHNFILLGLRGQAKSRILRGLVDLLDEQIPVVPGCEIHDNPLAPLCAACRARIAKEGDSLPVAWLPREARFVEKLATPDVTIADMVGDIDPIKAAQTGLNLSDELTCTRTAAAHANRGIFAINELPDLAGRFRSDCSTSCRKATSRSKATRFASSSTSCSSSPPTPRTTRPAARSSRRSKTASDRRSGRTTRRRARMRWRSPGRRRGPIVRAVSRWRSLISCARWSKRWRSRRDQTARSISGRG